MLEERWEAAIEGERWATAEREDVRRWLSVYQQMTALHEHLLSRAADRVEGGSERRALESSLAGLRGRLDYWRSWWLKLAGLDYDGRRRRLSGAGGVQELSGREAQLLELFLDHPERRFTSRQLLALAWGDGDLSEEQLRNYVVRVRQKLRAAGARCELESRFREGYALVFAEPPAGAPALAGTIEGLAGEAPSAL